MASDDVNARNPNAVVVGAPRLAARVARLARHGAPPPPSVSPPSAPLGAGPPNRHGMPALPPEQRRTRKWPVLDLGIQPDVDASTFRLRVDGAVERTLDLDYASLLALPQRDDALDFHCVTGWSRLDLRLGGVAVRDVFALCAPLAEATHLMVYGSDGYSTNLALAEAVKADVLLALRWDDAPLPREHGGPVRMVTPQLWAWKGAKWICRIEVMIGDRPGFWEERGYSMSAQPWRNDRYSGAPPASAGPTPGVFDDDDS